MTDDSWSEYRRLVLSEIERIDTRMKDMESHINQSLTRISEDLVGLKVKAGIWGFVCGLIPSALTIWSTK